MHHKRKLKVMNVDKELVGMEGEDQWEREGESVQKVGRIHYIPV